MISLAKRIPPASESESKRFKALLGNLDKIIADHSTKKLIVRKLLKIRKLILEVLDIRDFS